MAKINPTPHFLRIGRPSLAPDGATDDVSMEKPWAILLLAQPDRVVVELEVEGGGWSVRSRGCVCWLPQFDDFGGSRVTDVGVTEKPKAGESQRVALLAQRGGGRVFLEAGEGQKAQTWQSVKF